MCILLASHQRAASEQSGLLTQPALTVSCVPVRKLLKGREEAVPLESHLRLSLSPAPSRESRVAVCGLHRQLHRQDCRLCFLRAASQVSFLLHHPEGGGVATLSPAHLALSCALWLDKCLLGRSHGEPAWLDSCSVWDGRQGQLLKLTPVWL